jgi:hypothetical protein
MVIVKFYYLSVVAVLSTKLIGARFIILMVFGSATSSLLFLMDPKMTLSIQHAVGLSDFNFAAGGDWGCSSNASETVNSIVAKNTELTLGLGDYSYRPTADCWLDVIKPIEHSGQMKISLGNHDNEDENESKLQQYMTHFGLEKPYYSFDYQNVHFVTITTEVPFDIGTDQYTFVKNDLSKAASDPNIRWIVVYFHEPMYVSPNTHPIKPDVSFRSIYHPLFDLSGVDLVLQAHMRGYERSYPIKYNNSDSPSEPIKTSTNTKSYKDPEGEIYATVGTAGQPLFDFSAKDPYIVNQDDQGYGHLNVEVIDDGLTMNATFYTNDGTIKDQFSISK